MCPYELCPPKDSDYEFLRNVHHTTLRQHVEKIWGWDEEIQDRFFSEDFVTGQIQIIRAFGQAVGYLQLNLQGDILHIVNILILPDFQNRKLGSTIIKDLIAKSQVDQKTLSLGVFKINKRAKAFYESLQFQKYDETATHDMMEIKPGPSSLTSY